MNAGDGAATTGTTGVNGEDVARIVDVAIVAGHDARAEVVIQLRYPNGGRSQVRLDQEAAQHVLDQAGIAALDDLRGRRWDILKPALGAPPPAG